MQTTTVEIPEPASHNTVPRWIVEDLLARSAQRLTWDERITYTLPGGGSIKVATLNSFGLSIVPATLDAAGVCVMKTDLVDNIDSVTRRIRLSLNRARRS